MKEQNCGHCPHIRFTRVMNMGVFGCAGGDSMPVVPHDADSWEGSGVINARFHRVPEWCPRPDSEVEKRSQEDAPAPRISLTALKFDVRDIPERLVLRNGETL